MDAGQGNQNGWRRAMWAMVPDGNGSVTLTEVAEPTCAADEVLIAVEAYSLNRGETFLLDSPPSGWRPGKDVAGVIVATGAAVTGLRVGGRVVAHPEHSGWAHLTAVNADRVAALPDTVPSAVAAALPLAGLTALRLLRAVGALPGRSVLITGASGGVGHYFVELAAGLGARITALCSSAGRGRRLIELGAERVITNLDEARGPYDIVVESVGGDLFPAAWRLLSDRGLFVWMGQASRTPPTIDFFDWTGGANAQLRKFLYSDSDISDGDDLATLVRLVATGRLHPEIGLLTDWTNTGEAIAELLARRIRGNAVLEVTR
ncbi:MAG TPA: zinc-binding dehydrogenase [Jatrophihabitantaceae bacterium]|nr:zinc-binding dehydrogenase [Jatrophihabitantaceae bacterium]